MPDYFSGNKAPWGSLRYEIEKVIIKDGVTNIGNRAFINCSNLASVEIPNSVTSIGDYAFEHCEYLHSIEIPNSVTSIGEGAFNHCSSLTSIEIPNSVTSIGSETFYYCESLTSIEIPNLVTSIGDRAFNNCRWLSSITFKGSNPPKFGENVFYEVTKTIPVYVPANSIEAYKKAVGDFGFSNIKETITLTDNEAYTRESDSEGVAVSYTRNFTNVKWQALYLPFSLKYEDWKDDFEMARINGIVQRDNDDDGEIDETEVEIIKMKSGSTQPNAPYLIRAKTTGEKTFFVKNTTVYAAPEEEKFVDCSTTTATFFFVGTYNTIPYETLAEYGYYAMGGGELVMSNGSDLKPFRWFMVVETRSYRPSSHDRAKVITLKVLDEDETTGVANIQHQSDNTQLYDLNGRKVSENNLKPGVYVKNGKKFVVN